MIARTARREKGWRRARFLSLLALLAAGCGSVSAPRDSAAPAVDSGTIDTGTTIDTSTGPDTGSQTQPPDAGQDVATPDAPAGAALWDSPSALWDQALWN